jgi:hypothetical protein
VAGFFLDSANQWHGFVLSNGSYFVQDYPAATTGSFTLGISANATLVGEFKSARRSANRLRMDCGMATHSSLRPIVTVDTIPPYRPL